MKTENIQSYASSLESAMLSKLETASEERQDEVMSLLTSLVVVSESILTLRKFTIAYQFENAQEEIRFFKEIKPRFVSEHYYYSQLATIKRKEPLLKEKKIEYYSDALQRLRSRVNDDPLDYYILSGASNLDDKYFLRGNVPLNEITVDRDFSTGYDDILGQLKGNRRIGRYIQSELDQLLGEQIKSSGLTWTGSKTELVELIYGLESMGAFNKGKADIKDIAVLFESAFNITLGNFYRQFLDIKLRKKGKTLFLDEMREKLEIRISDFH